ncbi:MAG TPA: hypothetical protein VFS00_25720 [Polyangiaceae bacterium]|nr:hypothetical protein [Polyangiaceae bacterium]
MSGGELWRERWQRGRIGFHEGKPNAKLVTYFDRLGLAAGARVFVPLCGKAEDLAWLAARGLEVVGVELVREAAEAFFAEHDLVPRAEDVGPFRRLSAGGVSIYVGDVFELGRLGLSPFDALYDRAALVALPRAERERYVPIALDALSPGSKSLVITFTTEPPAEGGPPYHVDRAEVWAAFGPRASIELLEDDPTIHVGEESRKRGIEKMHELAFLITRALPDGASQARRVPWLMCRHASGRR